MIGGGVHFSFEAIGLKQTTEQAFDMLRPGGAATVIGMVPYGTKVEIHAADFLQEKKLLGCAMGSESVSGRYAEIRRFLPRRTP